MPGLGVVPKPRISAGFKTVRSGGLSMPKPPATPKAGRLSPTGGRIGGVPGKTAPRVPGPAKPPAVPGMASKALLTNARRANGRWGFKATPLAQVLGKAPYKRKPGHVMPVGGDFMKGISMSEREYVIEKSVRSYTSGVLDRTDRRIARADRPFFGAPPSGARRVKRNAKFLAVESMNTPTGRKVVRGVQQFGREMDPNRNVGAKVMSRMGVAQIGEGAAALAANRGMRGYAPEIARGLKGVLLRKSMPKGLARAPRWGVRAEDSEAANIFGHRRRLMHETGREAGRDIARGQREFADDDIRQMRQLKRNSRKEWANYQEKGPGFLMPAAKPKRRRVLP